MQKAHIAIASLSNGQCWTNQPAGPRLYPFHGPLLPCLSIQLSESANFIGFVVGCFGLGP